MYYSFATTLGSFIAARSALGHFYQMNIKETMSTTLS